MNTNPIPAAAIPAAAIPAAAIPAAAIPAAAIPAAAIPLSAAGTSGEAASPPFSAIPSGSFSVHMVNAVLGMFLESAASIEEIANENGLSIPVVLQCLDEQKAFLMGMLGTLELRVRLLAARAEAVAIETLRETAIIARDQETRRKAASKLLSHFAKLRAPTPSARHPRAASVSERSSAPDAHEPNAPSTCSRGTGVPPVATCSTSAAPAHVLNNEPGA